MRDLIVYGEFCALKTLFPILFEIPSYAIHIRKIQREIIQQEALDLLWSFRKKNAYCVLQGNRGIRDNRVRKNCMGMTAELTPDPKHYKPESDVFGLYCPLIVGVHFSTCMTAERTCQ